MTFLIPRLIRVLLIAIVFIRFVHGKKCQTVQSVEVDEEWFKKQTDLGWDNPMGSNMEVKKELEDIPADNMTLNNVKCMTMDVKASVTPTVQLRMTCRYEKLEKLKEQNCVVKTKGSPVENIFQFFGDVTLVKTDNEKYVLRYICLYAEKEAWTVYTPVGEKLSNDSKDLILRFLVSREIRTDKKDMKSKDDEVYIGKLKGVECKSKSATPDIMPKMVKALPIPPVLGGAVGSVLQAGYGWTMY